MILQCARCTEAQETLAHIVSIHCHSQSFSHCVSIGRSGINGTVQVVIHTFTCGAMFSVFFFCPSSFLSMFNSKTRYDIRQGIASLLWLMCDQWAVLVEGVYF